MKLKNDFLFVFVVYVFSVQVSSGNLSQRIPTLLQKGKLAGQLLTSRVHQRTSSFAGLTLGATLAVSYFLQQSKVYAQETTSKSQAPTVEDLFKHAASYKNVKDVDELELSKNPLRVKQYLHLAKENFVELYQTSHGFYFLQKLLEKDKSAIEDFTQLAIDNLVLIGKKRSSLIKTIIDHHSSYLDYVRNNNNPTIVKLIEKANQDFVTLVTQREGIDIVELLARKTSQARECFAITLSKNISSILEATYKNGDNEFPLYAKRNLMEIINRFPTLKDAMQKEVEENVSNILSKVFNQAANDDTVEIFLFLMELDKGNKALYAKTLIEDLAIKKRDYKSLSDHSYFLTMLFDHDEKEQFLSQAIQDLESIFGSYAVTQMLLKTMKGNPTFSHQVGAQLIQKIEILSELEDFKEQSRCDDVLEASIENPEINELFKKALCEKFIDIKKICENKNIFEFVDTMIQKNPEFNAHIGDLIIQHLNVFYTQFNNDAKYHYRRLNKHCLTNPEHCRKFTERLYSIIPKAEILFQDLHLFNIVLESLKKDADFDEYINNLVADYFSACTLEKTTPSVMNLSTYLNAVCRYDEGRQRFWLLKALTNLRLACDIEALTNLLCHTIRAEENNEISDLISQSFIDHFNVVEKTEYGPLVALFCFEHTITFKKMFIKKVEENIENVSPITLAFFSYLSPCNEKVKEWIKRKNDTTQNDDFHTMLKVQAFVDHCKEECNLLEEIPKNQTMVHMQKELKDMLSNITSDLPFFGENLLKYPLILPYYLFHQWQHYFSLTDPFIKDMIKQVLKKENELKADYYTFIHGQRHEYLPQEQLHTFLQCVINKQKTNNQHLLLHVKESVADPELLKQEKEIRKTLLKNGRTNDEERQRLLFVNWAFFANSSNLGSSSANYITADANVNDYIQLTPERVFSLNNLEHLYPKYQHQLAQLQQEFEEITQRGTCILLAIPKEKIQKHIYLAYVGGPKRKITIEGIGETDDIVLIMKTLESTPEKIADTDKIEFCIPMTYDKKGALNPESGIKIFAFTAADKEKLDVYYAHQREIFEQIRNDIAAN